MGSEHNLDTAPIADREDDPDCARDDCGGVYVLYDNDRVCRVCGHLSGTGSGTTETHDMNDYRAAQLPDQWYEFEKQRENYDGFRGEDRVKMVGGFIGAYPRQDEDDDSLLSFNE